MTYDVPGEDPLRDAENAMQLYWEGEADSQASRDPQHEDAETERQEFDAHQEALLMRAQVTALVSIAQSLAKLADRT